MFCPDLHTALQIAEEFTFAVQGNLAVTREDCGAKHAKVDTVSSLFFASGSATTLTGYGIVDEDVTGVHFTATVPASGAKLASCEGMALWTLCANSHLVQTPLPSRR